MLSSLRQPGLQLDTHPRSLHQSSRSGKLCVMLAGVDGECLRGVAKTIFSDAPLRLSFFGGGSDFPEVFSHQPGAVLSTAIGYCSRVSLARPPAGPIDRPIRLHHAQVELRREPREIRHPLLRAAFERRPRSTSAW